MKPDLILHYAPDNASLCVKLLLGAMETDYQTVLVNRRTLGQKSADYLALNPNGLIPTLQTPDGPIYETGAILLWLADRAPGTVFPAVGASDRGMALARLFWVSNTLHASARMLFYPDQYIETDPEAFRIKTRQNLVRHFDQLQSTGVPTDLLTQCYLAPIIRWCGLYGGDTAWFDLSKWSHLLSFAKVFESTSNAHAVCLTEGLGLTPFSAPTLPNPPEGSAT